MSSVPTSIIAAVCVTSPSLRIVPAVNVALGIAAAASVSLATLASIITTSAEGAYSRDDDQVIIGKAAAITNALNTKAARRM